MSLMQPPPSRRAVRLAMAPPPQISPAEMRRADSHFQYAAAQPQTRRSLCHARLRGADCASRALHA